MRRASAGVACVAALMLLLAQAATAMDAKAPPRSAATPTAPSDAGIARTPPAAIALVNAGFEAPADASGRFGGWETSGHAQGDAYRFDRDDSVHHGGGASVRIRRNSTEPWGMLHQQLAPAGLAGRRLEFAAWLRTDKVSGDGAILVIRTLANGAVDRHVFQEPALVGTHDWKRYSVSLDIPKSTSIVELGVMLQGDGTLWVDDASLVVLP